MLSISITSTTHCVPSVFIANPFPFSHQIVLNIHWDFTSSVWYSFIKGDAIETKENGI